MALPVWQWLNHPFFDLLVNLFSDEYAGLQRLSEQPGVSLKLPKKVTFTGGKTVSYTYTASGEVRDYIGPFQYLNNAPFEVTHEEGRVLPGSPNGYEYFLRDHLGNVRAVVANAGGVLVSQMVDYDPWGLELSGLGSGLSNNRAKFNGKETLAELGGGLLDFGARGYDATIGRWGVVDPMAEVSRRFSPFVYGNNNPVRMIDPDGMMATRSSQGFTYSDGYTILNSGETTGSVTYDGAYQSGSDGNKQAVGQDPQPKPGRVAQTTQERKQQSQDNYKQMLDRGDGIEPDHTIESIFIGGAVTKPINAFFGRFFGGLFGRFFGKTIQKTGTVWDDIVATQANYPNTVLPKSFELATNNGTKVWVHGNATEHIAEYLGMKAVNYSPSVVRLATQQQLASLQGAVNLATQNGIIYNQIMTVGGWELNFAAPRMAGQLPALIHALPK